MYRGMAVPPLLPAHSLIRMALATQLRFFILEKTRMTRDMQAMACITLIVAYRGVFVFTLEINTVVTLDTVKRQRSAGSSHQKQERKDNVRDTFIHHGVLSS